MRKTHTIQLLKIVKYTKKVKVQSNSQSGDTSKLKVPDG